MAQRARVVQHPAQAAGAVRPRVNANEGVRAKMLEALVREYGRENVVEQGNVAHVRVPWSYTPPNGEKKVEGHVQVAVPLNLDGIVELIEGGTYTEEQVLAFVRRGAILAATQAERQKAAVPPEKRRERLEAKLAALRAEAERLKIDLAALLK